MTSHSLSRRRPAGGDGVPAWALVLLAAAAGAAAFAAPGYFAGSGTKGFRYVILAAVASTSLGLAVARPAAMIPLFVVVVATNRGLRRVLDWVDGGFQATTVISLLSLAAALPMAIPILRGLPGLHPRQRRVVLVLAAIISYGVVRGSGFGASMLWATAGWITALFPLGLTWVLRPDAETADRWVRWIVGTGVFLAAYGWFQYVYLPPWDAMWIEQNLSSNTKTATAQGFRIFSTMSSTGPLAGTLAFTTCLALVHPRWRTKLSWAAPAVIASALLLSRVRSAWLTAVLILLAYFALAGRGDRRRMLTALAVVAALLLTVGPRLPGADQVIDRMGTFGGLESDTSFNARTHILSAAPGMIAAYPIGRGLGSTGTGARMTSGQNVVVAFDNGFLWYFYVFGIAGAAAFFWALWQMWLLLRRPPLEPRVPLLGSNPPRFRAMGDGVVRVARRFAGRRQRFGQRQHRADLGDGRPWHRAQRPPADFRHLEDRLDGPPPARPALAAALQRRHRGQPRPAARAGRRPRVGGVAGDGAARRERGDAGAARFAAGEL